MQLTTRWVCGGLLLIVSAPGVAQTRVTSKLQVYVDNDATQVISPLVRATGDLGNTEISAGYVADIVTSASIDIVTQASKTTIHDVRQEPSVDISQTIGSTKVSGGYVYSRERDYVSNGAAAAVEQRLWENNTTLGLGYRLSLDDVGRAGDVNFSRSLTVHTVAASWSQVVTPNLLAQLGYELSNGSGFFASPYRFVPVRATDSATMTTWVPETDPEHRLRHAFVIGASRHLFSDSAVQGDYRFYADDWGMTSHTFELRYLVNLTNNLELRVRNRFYAQEKADFYQSSYSQIMRYMTYDKELGSLWTELFGLKLSWRALRSIDLDAKIDVFHLRYLDFLPLSSRSGANLGVGIAWTPGSS